MNNGLHIPLRGGRSHNKFVRPQEKFLFLASDTVDSRESQIREFLSGSPSLALVLAAINFEWTVSRAVLFLSPNPNGAVRTAMKAYYSLDGYKDLWKAEVVTSTQPTGLAAVVRNWSELRGAFDARNVLVHGKDRYTRNMATPHVSAALKSVRYVDAYCVARGVDLSTRMPVRRAKRPIPSSERP